MIGVIGVIVHGETKKNTHDNGLYNLYNKIKGTVPYFRAQNIGGVRNTKRLAI